MEESYIKSFASQILSAMFDYSAKGIIHRDIKHFTRFRQRNKSVKFWDKGQRNGKSKLSTRIDLADTERYFSPELKDGERKSIESDVLAFDVVILQLTFGRSSFKDSEISRMYMD